MPYSITCTTKILILAIVKILFILVDVLCEFTMVLGVHILLSRQEEEVHYSSEGTDVHTHQHIHQKDLNFCMTSYYFAKLLLNSKKHKQGIQLLWCL